MMMMMIVTVVVHFAKNLTAVGHYAMNFNTRMDRRRKKRRIMGFKLKQIGSTKLTKRTNY